MPWTAQDRGKKDSQRGPWPAWLRRRLPSADARMRSPANLAAALACRAAAAACRAAAAACRHASSGLRRCRPAAAAPAETSMQELLTFDWRLLLLYGCTFSKSEVNLLFFDSVLLAVGFSSKDQTPESVTAMVTPEHLPPLSLHHHQTPRVHPLTCNRPAQESNRKILIQKTLRRTGERAVVRRKGSVDGGPQRTLMHLLVDRVCVEELC